MCQLKKKLLKKNEKKVSKVIDTKLACCYDTLTAPIKEVILISPNLKREFNIFIEEVGYEILEKIKEEDEIRFRIKVKNQKTDRRKEERGLYGLWSHFRISNKGVQCNMRLLWKNRVLIYSLSKRALCL